MSKHLWGTESGRRSPRTWLTRQNGRNPGSDGGQAAVLVVVVTAVLLAAIVVALGVMGRVALDRTRSQTAADAAALASLDGGRDVAVTIAERHGASVVDWFRGPEAFEVTVTVRLGDTTATARASNAP